MSEITKLYENAGIKKELLCGDRDVLCGHVRPDGLSRFAYGCYGCEYKNDAYPPFTPEKQLELIKLLSYYYNITISKNFENDYTFQCQGDDVRRYVFTSGQDFAEQIVSFVNMCYELLPETEQEQIRSILNG